MFAILFCQNLVSGIDNLRYQVFFLFIQNRTFSTKKLLLRLKRILLSQRMVLFSYASVTFCLPRFRRTGP